MITNYEFPNLYSNDLVKKNKKTPIFLLFLFLFSIGGYLLSAYFLNLWPFRGPFLTPQELFLGLPKNVRKIETAHYHGSFSLKTQKREADLKALEVKIPELEILETQYKRDQKRFTDLQEIREKLEDFFKSFKRYPSTLNEIGGDYKDPKGFPYQYFTKENGQNFNLVIIFETSESIETIQEKKTPSYFIKYATLPPKIEGQKVVFDKNSSYWYFYYPKLSVKLPLFLRILVQQEESLGSLPGNFLLSLNTSGSFRSNKATPDSQFKFSGEVNYEDFLLAVEAEFLKKENAYYFKLNKFPGIILSGLYKIKEEWIQVLPKDIATFSPFLFISEEEYQEKEEEIRRILGKHLLIFFDIATQEGLFLGQDTAKKEKINSTQVFRYNLKVNKGKVASFYRSFTKELKEKLGDKAFFQFNQTTFTVLNSDSFKEVIDYLNKNGKIELLIDKNGYPLKLEYTFKLAPSKAVYQLEDRELVLSGSFSFSNINKPIVISTPKQYLTFDEAYMKLTGLNKEEYLFIKQVQNIKTIRRGLDIFFDFAKRYPESLDQLKMTGKEIEEWVKLFPQEENQSSLEVTYPSAYYQTSYQNKPILRYIPVDVFTKKPYEYKGLKDNYTLTYTIQLPPYQRGTYPLGTLFYRDLDTSIYGLSFIEGINTANKTNISIEAKKQLIDRDGDKLADSFEEYLGTDKNKKDTDGDGFDDRGELLQRLDPLGPGELQYKSTMGEILF